MTFERTASDTYAVLVRGVNVGTVRKTTVWTGRSYATVWQRLDGGLWFGSHKTRAEAAQMAVRAHAKRRRS